MMALKSMIPIIDYASPSGKKYLEKLLFLRRQSDETIAAKVSSVIADVRNTGDKALFAFTKKFDGVSLTARTLRIAPAEIARQAAKTPAALQKAIREAAKRIRDYHKQQHGCEFTMRSPEGSLRQIVRPLNPRSWPTYAIFNPFPHSRVWNPDHVATLFSTPRIA